MARVKAELEREGPTGLGDDVRADAGDGARRDAARQGGDSCPKGWRPGRVWPDFVAIDDGEAGRPPIRETKGAHLDGSDADYEKRVPKTLEGAFECGAVTVRDGPAKGVFRLVFDKAEFPAALAAPAER